MPFAGLGGPKMGPAVALAVALVLVNMGSAFAQNLERESFIARMNAALDEAVRFRAVQQGVCVCALARSRLHVFSCRFPST